MYKNCRKITNFAQLLQHSLRNEETDYDLPIGNNGGF